MVSTRSMTARTRLGAITRKTPTAVTQPRRSIPKAKESKERVAKAHVPNNSGTKPGSSKKSMAKVDTSKKPASKVRGSKKPTSKTSDPKKASTRSRNSAECKPEANSSKKRRYSSTASAFLGASKRQKPSTKALTQLAVLPEQSSAEPGPKPKPKPETKRKRRMIIDWRANNRRHLLFQLWSACVAKFLYPALSRLACLAVGPALTHLDIYYPSCLVGRMYDIDDSGDEKGYQGKDDESSLYYKNELDFPSEIEVMMVPLELEGDLSAVVEDGRADEAAFKRKFGKNKYEKVRAAFFEALEPWKEDKEELNRRAFGYYKAAAGWEEIALLCSKDHRMYRIGYGKRFLLF